MTEQSLTESSPQQFFYKVAELSEHINNIDEYIKDAYTRETDLMAEEQQAFFVQKERKAALEDMDDFINIYFGNHNLQVALNDHCNKSNCQRYDQLQMLLGEETKLDRLTQKQYWKFQRSVVRAKCMCIYAM